VEAGIPKNLKIMDNIGFGDLLLREENSSADSVNMRIPLCTWI
jgi:hypothetical protein